MVRELYKSENYVGVQIYQGIRMIKRSERSFLWSLQTPLALHTQKTRPKNTAYGPACYSGLPNKRTGTLINFQKKMHPVRSY